MRPHYYKLVSGCGESEIELVSFDNALMNAGIGDYNLVKISSIIPPSCEYREKIDLTKGSILFAAYARKYINEGQKGSTAVAIALPCNGNENGVIFEAVSDDSNAELRVREMCREAMLNRGREMKDIYSSSVVFEGIRGKCVCGVSAVVMW